MHQVTCGIEIHQQLDTHKLFCSCRSQLVEEEGKCFNRRLRPTQSEMGEIDRAAMAQAERRMHFAYQAPAGVSPGGGRRAAARRGPRGHACIGHRLDHAGVPGHGREFSCARSSLTVQTPAASSMPPWWRSGRHPGGQQPEHWHPCPCAWRRTPPARWTPRTASHLPPGPPGHPAHRDSRPRTIRPGGGQGGGPEAGIHTALNPARSKRGLGTIREDPGVNISVPGGARSRIKGRPGPGAAAHLRTERDGAAALAHRDPRHSQEGATAVHVEAMDITPAAGQPVQGNPFRHIQGREGLLRAPSEFAGVLRSADGASAPGCGDGPACPFQGRGRDIPLRRAAGPCSICRGGAVHTPCARIGRGGRLRPRSRRRRGPGRTGPAGRSAAPTRPWTAYRRRPGTPCLTALPFTAAPARRGAHVPRRRTCAQSSSRGSTS